MSADVAEPTPASSRESGDPAPRHPADETRRPVDACDVVSFLLEREHLAAAFELLQDVVESTSGVSTPHGARAARADADAGRLQEARESLERYFGDRERFPARDLRAYADETDVPLLQARVREQESRARVAEYDAELATEDLERARLELEAAELERRAAEKRRGAAGNASPRRAEDANAEESAEKAKGTGDFATSSLTPALNMEAFADPDATRAPHEETSSSPPPPLPPPSESERRALNTLVADYLDRRGYRATRLMLRDEAFSDFSAAPVADGLRRAVHRASKLDASDAARDELRARERASSRRAEELERDLAEKAAESESLAATASERSRRADELLRQLEDARRSIAGLETSRADLARDFERAAATTKHLERDLEAKTREFKRALAEERRSATRTDETIEDATSTTSTSAPALAFEARAEEEATIRTLTDALPRVASATLVNKRHELLPLFARAATRHKVAAARRESLRACFDLVKRPERAHHDALAATAFAVARDAGEERALSELVPVLRAELAHKRRERRVAACACVGRVAGADVSDNTRWRVLFPALRAAFERAADAADAADAAGTASACPATRSASLSAFEAVCDASAAADADAAAAAESFLVAALADASEHVSERASETAAAAMTRWRVRADGPSARADEAPFAGAVAHLETFAKGHVATRVAAALGATTTSPRDVDRWRARFFLRLFARTMETFREEAVSRADVADDDGRLPDAADATFGGRSTEPRFVRWFDANAAELARLLVRSIPRDDADATLRRDAAAAVRALCAAAGAGVARERVVPALTEPERADVSVGADLTTAMPIALAAAVPHGGQGALEAFVRGYVARESAPISVVGAESDDARKIFTTNALAMRRAVALCDDGDGDGDSDSANPVRDTIVRVLEAVASGCLEETRAGSESPPLAPALLATTLLGAAAAASPAAAAARALPALGRLAANIAEAGSWADYAAGSPRARQRWRRAPLRRSCASGTRTRSRRFRFRAKPRVTPRKWRWASLSRRCECWTRVCSGATRASPRRSQRRCATPPSRGVGTARFRTCLVLRRSTGLTRRVSPRARGAARAHSGTASRLGSRRPRSRRSARTTTTKPPSPRATTTRREGVWRRCVSELRAASSRRRRTSARTRCR